MRNLRYTNAILTVLAVLLTLNLYAGWSTSPGGRLVSLEGEAVAQETGIANAGAQRREMIDVLKQLNATVGEMKKTLTDGSARVKVEAGKTD